MWFLLLAVWLILLVQIRIRSLRTAVAAYFMQAALVFGLCAYEAFQRPGAAGNHLYWLILGILMVVAVPAALALSAKREAAVFAAVREARAVGPELFAPDKVSLAAALGLGLGYVWLDSLLPFAAGRDYMATGAAFSLAGMGMILLSAGRTPRLIGLCSVGNGLFLTCFLLFGEAGEIMRGMLLVQIIVAAVILGTALRREPA